MIDNSDIKNLRSELDFFRTQTSKLKDKRKRIKGLFLCSAAGERLKYLSAMVNGPTDEEMMDLAYVIEERLNNIEKLLKG